MQFDDADRSDHVTRLRGTFERAGLAYARACLRPDAGCPWTALTAMQDAALEWGRAVESTTAPEASAPIAPAPLLSKSFVSPDNVVAFPVRRRAPGDRP